MFKLQDLLAYNTIVLQCHDNPDVDAIGSAYALARYFTDGGCAARLVYGGFNRITKPNIATFVEDLAIPLEFIGRDTGGIAALTEDENPLLITVDCQYGAGNVTKLEAETVCVIDHHLQETDLAKYTLIEPYLGSCATVVWRLLKGVGYAYDEKVSTALYYGLYTDTNSLSEIFHPIDKDMLEDLSYDARLVRKWKGSNLTREELLVAGRALHGARYVEDLGSVLYQAEPCDPNILGFISDLTLQVVGVETCVGFSEINGGVKLSLRSATPDVMANEMAAYLTRELGSGGGNREKAGGFMRLSEDTPEAMELLSRRLHDYYTTFDKVVAGQTRLDKTGMRRYIKKKLTVGYVKLEDVYPPGTAVTIRTLEGDAAFTVSADTYLMVGIQGETYPIAREKFEKSYAPQPGAFAFDPALTAEGFYAPTVRDDLYHKSVDLIPYTRPCLPKGDTFIWARPVQRDTKVFTRWYTEGYMLGKPGDYLAMRCDDEDDLYIIDRRIFHLTYEKAPEGTSCGMPAAEKAKA